MSVILTIASIGWALWYTNKNNDLSSINDNVSLFSHLHGKDQTLPYRA